MSAYVSNRRLIKNALVYILQQVQYDAGSGPSNAFELVTTDVAKQYDQEPTCLVHRAPSKDVKGAVGEQDHCIAFEVIITLELENNSGRTRQQTEDYMDDLEELAISALDEADWHNSLNTAPAPPTIATWRLNATDVMQLVGTAKPGRILMSVIRVEVDYTVDL